MFIEMILKKWLKSKNNLKRKQILTWKLRKKITNSCNNNTKILMKITIELWTISWKLKKHWKICKMKEKRWSWGSISSKIEKVKLTRELRCAEIVVKSFMKKRISTGAAGHIEATMEEKCGGVVESKVKTRLVASSRSTR